MWNFYFNVMEEVVCDCSQVIRSENIVKSIYTKTKVIDDIYMDERVVFPIMPRSTKIFKGELIQPGVWILYGHLEHNPVELLPRKVSIKLSVHTTSLKDNVIVFKDFLTTDAPRTATRIIVRTIYSLL